MPSDQSLEVAGRHCETGRASTYAGEVLFAVRPACLRGTKEGKHCAPHIMFMEHTIMPDPDRDSFPPQW